MYVYVQAQTDQGSDSIHTIINPPLFPHFKKCKTRKFCLLPVLERKEATGGDI